MNQGRIKHTICDVLEGYLLKSRNFRPAYIYPVLLACSLLLTACNSQPTQDVQTGLCPQPRTTEYAPAAIAGMANPLAMSKDNLDAGKDLYQKSSSPVACMECHGKYGDGNGRMANMFEPAPRNFTCSQNVADLPDGQLFWIIKNGSIGTSMPAFDKLSDEQIWQLTIYLRSLEIKSEQIKADQEKSGELQANIRQTAL